MFNAYLHEANDYLKYGEYYLKYGLFKIWNILFQRDWEGVEWIDLIQSFAPLWPYYLEDYSFSKASLFMKSAYTVVPAYPQFWFWFPWCQLPMVNHALAGLSDICQKTNSIPTLCHNTDVIHLFWSHHTGILSPHSKIFGERGHIHIILMTVDWYNCSIRLLLIVVDLLPFLFYKVNFITGMYIWEKTVCRQFGTLRSFRQMLGVSECIPHR